MAHGLNVADVVNVTVNLSPLAAQYRNFGVLNIMGSSPVIDVDERIRLYTTLDGVANDFGTTAPEYLAAQTFFSQVPQPAILYVSRWAQSPSQAVLKGAILTPLQQLLSNFTSITAGSLAITVDGTLRTLTNVNLSAATNLNGVASLINTAAAGSFTVVWDATNSRFVLTSPTTGASSTLSYATSSPLASALALSTAASALPPVNGIVAETALAAAQVIADKNSQWYGLMLAPVTPVADSVHLALAGYVEGTSPSRIYGVTIQNTNVLDPNVSSDLGSQLKTLNYKRTFSQYSSGNPYAVASMFGRAFTVNFEANNTTLTLKFKQEPGVAAETLTETQALALDTKNVNVFVNYNNDTAILQQGEMANGYFFDEVHGTDWLQNAIQTDVYNLLYQSQTKIPQTDEGTHLIVTTIEATCARAVNNGLAAPGVWNVQGFGQLKQGDTLSKGFYVFAPPVALQSQADREARKSVPIQVALKLAGAIHSVNVLVSVNR